MSRFFWLCIFALLLLTVWTATLEFNDEKFASKNSVEDVDEDEDAAVEQNNIPATDYADPAFVKDTLERKNPQSQGNSLKELWEMIPLKQQESDIK